MVSVALYAKATCHKSILRKKKKSPEQTVRPDIVPARRAGQVTRTLFERKLVYGIIWTILLKDLLLRLRNNCSLCLSLYMAPSLKGAHRHENIACHKHVQHQRNHPSLSEFA